MNEPFPDLPEYLLEEYRYRYEERLGILCGDATPTPEQVAVANREAAEWVEGKLK